MSATIQPAPVRRSVVVKAPPARAFEVFTAGVGRWWPPTHHVGASPLKLPIIEPREGGRWYSVCQDDSECDIGRVLAWDPPSRLVLSWQLDGQWKYDPDLITEIEVRFTSQADGSTKVDLEHRHIERMGVDADLARAQVDAPNGWTHILSLYAQAANA